MSVSASNSSSSVPNPPGNTAKASAYFTNMILRAKKYWKEIGTVTYDTPRMHYLIYA
jgi:hypothetical protein